MKVKKNDKIYTPPEVAKRMIEMCEFKEGQTVLDPCYGGGVFYNNLPDYVNKDYCEIEMGKDFFEYHKKVDWIIGNPPDSLWNEWIKHTCKLCQKFCYIIGALKLNSNRLKLIIDEGFGITKIECVCIDWWFGCYFIIVFEKNKSSLISAFSTTVYCDYCNTRCGRGVKGKCPNTCGLTLCGKSIDNGHV